MTKTYNCTLIYCGAKFGQCKFSLKEAPGEGLSVMVLDEDIYRPLPSHRKHRVESTTPDEPTIWLAVFYTT